MKEIAFDCNFLQELINDAETRYMDVISFKINSDLLNIVLACSDGVLRKFEFNFSTEKLRLENESDPAESHAFLRIEKSVERNVDFLTSSTNGKVGFWTMKSLKKLKEVSVHSSGINSLLGFPNVGIVTGGDDGAMGLISTKNRIKNSVNSGHVTGIAILDEDRVLTCSVDQRVSVWKVYEDRENPFELVSQKFSHVPDLHDLIVCRKEGKVFVVVVGAGMQIFEID